jgi:hypothetical protein
VTSSNVEEKSWGILTTLSVSPARAGPECVLSAAAAAIAAKEQGTLLLNVASTSDSQLFSARSPVYVICIPDDWGSVFVAARMLELVIVRVGDPYKRFVTLDVVILNEESTHDAVVSPPASV